ncbi:hypothetical protein SAMN05216489_06143 [Streptomyces sp. 3213]|uniref:hypothetical protein n=1 Tax=Streptomyces sp. 3213.3 TaxID=1855348 RepID=UPI000894F709|nr:hypothetical protein [Streptomyces sp. 3213.3]SEE30425.1 hypothetical protein SAMN05216489_06143 [Streptomyces sp. 3213] [Streptomyces sp. 3213.3]
MSASSASENQDRPQPYAFAGVSMRELLAAGEAAKAVSTPPREAPPVESRKAA